MSMADKIKHLRKQFKLTQKDLADRLDVAPSAVSGWERGANNPLMDKLEIMAEMFSVPISYFFEETEIGDYGSKTLLPVYGNVYCGNSDVIFELTTEYEAIPEDWVKGGNYFFLRAKGDSMIGAKIHEGDLLLIRNQDVVENGEIAAVVIDDSIVLKRVYKQEDSFTLVSENPKYPPRTFKPDTDKNIHILGKLKKSITEH